MLAATVARRLDALGFGSFADPDTPASIFLHDLPPEPADAIGVWTEAGPQPGPVTRRPGFQIIVRRDPHASTGRARTGYDVARQILDDLGPGPVHDVWAEGTPDALRVAWCQAVQAEPFDLGPDDNGSPKWSVRFELETNGTDGAL